MSAPITDNPFSHPRLGGTHGPTGQGTASSNSGPGQITYFGTGAIYATACVGSGFTTGIHPPTYGYEPARHEGIRVGEIDAWRAWRVRGGYLTAITADLVWAPNDVVSGDIKRHGIHAFKTPSDVMTYVKGWGGPMVVGRVALWGEVIEHESGYRAQYAKPVSIEFVVEGNIPERELADIRKTYGFENKEAA